MNKQREALKLALEVLEEINKLSIGENAICLPAEIDTAMDAIREALAEPEQELICDKDPQGCWNVRCQLGKVCKNTTPPTRKPLTDEQISAIVQSMSAHTWDAHMLARAIERAHGIGD